MLFWWTSDTMTSSRNSERLAAERCKLDRFWGGTTIRPLIVFLVYLGFLRQLSPTAVSILFYGAAQRSCRSIPKGRLRRLGKTASKPCASLWTEIRTSDICKHWLCCLSEVVWLCFCWLFQICHLDLDMFQRPPACLPILSPVIWYASVPFLPYE